VEMLSINNVFFGSLGGVKANASPEQSLSPEGKAIDFFAALKSFIEKEFVKGEAINCESLNEVHQLSIPPSSYAAPSAALQKMASLPGQGKGADCSRATPSGDPLKGQTAKGVGRKEISDGSLVIDAEGADAVPTNVLAVLLTALACTLTRTQTISLTVETATEDGCGGDTAVEPREQSCSGMISGPDRKSITPAEDLIASLLAFVSDALSQGMKTPEAGNKVPEVVNGSESGQSSLETGPVVNRERIVPVTGGTGLPVKEEDRVNSIGPLLTLISEALKQGAKNSGAAGGGIDGNYVTDEIGQASTGTGQLKGETERSEKTGLQAVVAKVVAPLITLISGALEQGLVPSETADSSRDENALSYTGGQSFFNIAEGTNQIRPVVSGLAEGIAGSQITKSAYMNTEQFVAKKEGKGEDSRTAPVVERAPMKDALHAFSDEVGFFGSSSKAAEKGLQDQAGDEVGVPARTVAGHPSNRLEAVDTTEEGGRLSAGQILRTEQGEERVFTETVAREKGEIVEPHTKGLKVSSRESDYLPFPKDGSPDSAPLHEAQGNKTVKETAFASVMTDKIEKIIEQLSARGSSMDMVLRLKIDDRETLLVGLKNEGQKVIVDVKTSNEGTMNILQTQKETISRNLEEKHVYTNIFVDPDSNGGFERRESRREERKNERDPDKANFIEFLEASA
jgi:hypothetical protein